MRQKSEELVFALQIAREAGAIFKKYFGQPHTEWKADNTPLTQADSEINDFLIEQIANTYPNDQVYGEEASNNNQSSRVWAIDPVDGTQPFENGIPLSTIVIALVEAGAPQLAVVYDPLSDSMYHAERGRGAFLNEQPMYCNKNTAIEKNYFATSSGMPKPYASTGTIHDSIESRKGKVFNFRSFAYCAVKVAEGKFSGSVLGIGRLYDIVAPALIVEEAGGKATDLSGNSLNYIDGSNGIILTNGHLHDFFLHITEAGPTYGPSTPATSSQ